ncbi:MAG: putative bifunctional tRNA threonylcarbamoyladenosine biosynthesis protein [Candidatus Methanofastidiosum methylothiophilum]|uniref:non-specific serine/threonine protein kinase n=1 Tax=Candidatus Methanofastidiosum methylothiophilum TaxID=1705564 RepID=A0A150IJ38_9EURY|nr:MAG: putative bifunctional tRNA threonylcarbamoyladenosine biosynthesis protein [Candidatus Methanofastidiosum methylthiophilus]KYC47781.1 MAG: putative bifunctional tRNA threonylcarbamoyladenosine biosynthesis protein [Candidatus Methanofastidiosum methylthiophilus]KYC49409.1 MAG: putative bifunctional tRNA threonylcarbamoyladenosine biosynthesis protein [Candidatus Methanofastidiosum methylthiophilus]
MILKKGAEADLYLEDFKNVFGFDFYKERVVIKKRVKKNYRINELDDMIRGYRTVKEAKIINKAKINGVYSPTLYLVDLNEKSIVMEYIDGIRLKEHFSSNGLDRDIGRQIGESVGALHKGGIVHGDLTTSNMILYNGKLYFIDFGLSEESEEIEKQGIDIHLLRQALESTHFDISDELFKVILEGYSNLVGQEKKEEVLQRIEQIEKRGRYRKRD